MQTQSPVRIDLCTMATWHQRVTLGKRAAREVLQWLDWEASQEIIGHNSTHVIGTAQLLVGGGSCSHSCGAWPLRVGSEGRLCAAMQVRAAEAALFCPAAYLRCLVARGTLDLQRRKESGSGAEATFHRSGLCSKKGRIPLHPCLRVSVFDEHRCTC
jgi:hypothetical protein